MPRARTLGRCQYSSVSPIVGVLVFLALIAALSVLTWILSSRYGRGTGRRVREITTETALRDVNATILPYVGSDDASPRERLRTPPDD